MTKALTDRFVAGIASTTRENYFDKKTRGLVLRVSPRAKVWYFTYRHKGPTEWIKIGKASSIALAEARRAALDLRHSIDVEHKDPAAERRAPKPEPIPAPHVFTFKDFVPVFLKFQEGRIATWQDDRNKIAKYLSPAWDSLPLKDITRRHVQELLDTVEGQGLTTGVNRVQAVISRLFAVALDRQHIESHPAVRILKRFVEQPRERVLSDDELRALWQGLDGRPGDPADAIRLRLLLGQRGKQTAEMAWNEIDLDAAVWSLPGGRMKKRRPHLVPLPPMALEMLRRRRATAAENEARVFSTLKLQSQAHAALGSLHVGYTWTDLRRTLATRLAELGFDETTIARVLSHAKVSVTSKHYVQHAYVEEVRQALTAWDRELQRIIENKPKKAGSVLRMPRRAR